MVVPPHESMDLDQPTAHDDAVPKKKYGQPISTCKIEDYAINFLAYLIMQNFWNGISDIETMLGMLGIAINSSNCNSWATVANQLWIAQQTVADKVQKMNLTDKIEAMKEAVVNQKLH